MSIVSFVSLNKLLDENLQGYTGLVLSKPKKNQKASVSLIYQELLESTQPREYSRYTKIKIVSTVLDIKIDVLVDQYLKLVNKYSNMPYISLSGTTRA